MVSARKILFGFLVQSRARPTFLFLFNSFSQLDLGDDGVCVVNSLFIRKFWTIFLPKDVFFSLRTCILLASAFRVQCEKEYKSVFFLLLFFWRISFVFAFHLLFVLFYFCTRILLVLLRLYHLEKNNIQSDVNRTCTARIYLLREREKTQRTNG